MDALIIPVLVQHGLLCDLVGEDHGPEADGQVHDNVEKWASFRPGLRGCGERGNVESAAQHARALRCGIRNDIVRQVCPIRMAARGEQ
ncbi:hypothetical protein [Nocardia sp. No.11]|uniref:hypothetical protein n=1 Tax=Nocardia sp. No.11 TaxID=3128861 RepID=UPI00319DC6D9